MKSAAALIAKIPGNLNNGVFFAQPAYADTPNPRRALPIADTLPYCA
jgi:hypothetical protein